MTEHTRISAEGEAIIPKALCERLNWRPGMEVQIDTAGGSVIIRARSEPRERIDWDEFRRRVPPHDGPPVSLEEMEEAILAEAAERFERKTRAAVRSIDTNVIVRLLTADDAHQTVSAKTCLNEAVFVSHGVLMEAEWVLRRSYCWDRAQINRAFDDFLRLDHVEVDLPDSLLWALNRHSNGADWADMLHLIACRHSSSFVTFDQQLGKYAGSEAPVAVETLK